MKRKRFTEEQIIGILKEHELGANTANLCRKHGISEATFYKWKSKYGGMEVSEAKRLKALEAENTKLKKLLADAMLDNAALKDLLSKKWRRPWFEVFLMDLGLGPGERPRCFIIVVDEGADMGAQFFDGLERGAFELFSGKDREPDLDLIEPGGVGRRILEGHVLMTGEPHVALGLVSGQIVEDDMDMAVPIKGGDLVHEIEEFDPSAPLVMTADDLAGRWLNGTNISRARSPAAAT